MHMTGLRDKKNLFSFSKKEMSCLSLKNKASLHYYFSLKGFSVAASCTVEHQMPLLRKLKHSMHEANVNALEPDEIGWKAVRTALEQSLLRTVRVAGSPHSSC